MRGHLIMSEKERRRKAILSKMADGYISLDVAAKQMRVSYRQAKRIWKRYKQEGDEGLLHRNRGKAAVGHGFSLLFKEAVLSRYEERYEGFGPTLAAEKLAQEGYEVSRETLRQWLLESGLWKKRRKKQAHRKRRERRACFGELLQMDGSIHRWFGEGAGEYCLLNLVDDATTTTLSLLAEGETTEIVMLVLKEWIECYGIPQAVYVDLKSVYIAPKALSIFQQACNRLGIEVVKAYSAQAKGRVERNHAVYQDRFVKELRLEGIKTVTEANRLLKERFTDELNEKFAKEPSSSQDAHVPLLDIDLDEVLVWQYRRQLQNDWTISFQGKSYQLVDEARKLRAKQFVDVKRHLDGRLSISFNGAKYRFKEIGKVPRLRRQVTKPGHREQQARLAGQKGRVKSPWGQFNPGWLKERKKQADKVANL